MGQVNEDPQAIDRFRQALVPFVDRQTAALRSADREIQLTEVALADTRARAEREVERCQWALEACIAAALATGGYGGCGAEENALAAAEEYRARIIQAQDDVAIAAETFGRAEQSHLEYLSSEVPRMSAGLEARVAGLERYLAWRVTSGRGVPVPSAANSSRLLVEDLARKLPFGANRPPMPPELREGGAGGPEKLG